MKMLVSSHRKEQKQTEMQSILEESKNVFGFIAGQTLQSPLH